MKDSGLSFESQGQNLARSIGINAWVDRTPTTFKDFHLSRLVYSVIHDSGCHVIDPGLIGSCKPTPESGLDCLIRAIFARQRCLGFRVPGFGFTVTGSRFRVSCSGFGFSVFGFRVLGWGCVPERRQYSRETGLLPVRPRRDRTTPGLKDAWFQRLSRMPRLTRF